MISSAIKYLVSTYDDEHQYWPATFMNMNDAPHAPWWHVDRIAPPEGVGWANPSAELAGYLNNYSKLVPEEILSSINERVKLCLQENSIVGS